MPPGFEEWGGLPNLTATELKEAALTFPVSTARGWITYPPGHTPGSLMAYLKPWLGYYRRPKPWVNGRRLAV